MTVSVKVYRTSMGLIPNRKGEVTQDNTGFAHVDRPQIATLIENMRYLVGLIVVAPDDVDILTFDAISVELALVAIPIFRCEGEVTQDPQRIVGTNHSVDVIGDVVVHRIDSITADTPGGGPFAFPLTYMPLSSIGFQSPSVQFG